MIDKIITKFSRINNNMSIESILDLFDEKIKSKKNSQITDAKRLYAVADTIPILYILYGKLIITAKCNYMTTVMAFIRLWYCNLWVSFDFDATHTIQINKLLGLYKSFLIIPYCLFL